MTIDVDAFLRNCPREKRKRLQRELNKHPGARAELAKALEAMVLNEPASVGDLMIPPQHKAAGRCPGCGGKRYSPKRTSAVPEQTKGGAAVVVEVLCSHPFHTEKP